MKLETTQVTQASLVSSGMDSTKLHLQLTIKEYSSLPLSASYFIITNNPPLSVLLTKTFSYFRSFQLISSVKTCQGSKPVEQRSKSDCHSALQYSALHCHCTGFWRFLGTFQIWNILLYFINLTNLYYTTWIINVNFFIKELWFFAYPFNLYDHHYFHK